MITTYPRSSTEGNSATNGTAASAPSRSGGSCWYKNLTIEDLKSRALSLSLTSPDAGKPVLYRGQKSLDKLEIRFGSADPQWRSFDIKKSTTRQQNDEDADNETGSTPPPSIYLRSPPRWKDMPEIPIPSEAIPFGEEADRRVSYKVVVIPGDGNQTNNKDDRLVVVGGDFKCLVGGGHCRLKSVNCCEFRNYKDHRPTWTSLPDRNSSNWYGDFAPILLGQKIFVFGGKYDGIRSETFEVLDLNNLQDGWSLRPVVNNQNQWLGGIGSYKAVAVDHRIYVLAEMPVAPLPAHISKPVRDLNGFYEYDTQSGEWEYGVKLGITRDGDYDMTSITIPNEGTFVVVLGGESLYFEYQRSIEAYHVETKQWLHVTDIPDEYKYCMPHCLVAALGNRYILLAGGELDYEHDTSGNIIPRTSNVIAFDWVTKSWYELPSLRESQGFHYGSGVLSASGWLLTGGQRWEGRLSTVYCRPSFLEIAPGIGWAKEKLLLACKCNEAWKEDSDRPSFMDGRFDDGIWANILSFLFVPFQSEMECEGSIFNTSS